MPDCILSSTGHTPLPRLLRQAYQLLNLMADARVNDRREGANVTTQVIRSLTTVAIAAVIGVEFCAVEAKGAAPADTQIEQVLVTSGFRARPATTRGQQAQLRALPDNQFTTVQQNGNTYYLYPDKKDRQLYAGDHYAYRSFQNFFKNKHLRERGVFVWETNPADRSSNRTIQIWHDWTPFDQWR